MTTTTLKKLLLIEDNPGDARLMQALLGEAGHFEILWADRLATGQERLSEANSAIDLILLDLDLPDSRGLATFHAVYEQAPAIPIVVLTGLNDEAVAAKAIQAGAQDYLLKGEIDTTSLFRSLRYALEHHQLWQRLQRQTTALQKASRARNVLIKCGRALTRTEDEAALLHEVCRIITETGQYPLAWVGYAAQDKNKTIRIVAQAGEASDYVESLVVRWGNDEYGQGPSGMAIRTGQTQLVDHTLSDPHYHSWRTVVAQYGFTAVIALPLKEQERCFGTLLVYTRESGVFDDDEVDLLEQLAGDLAYGLTVLRTRAERRQAETRLLALSNLGRWLNDAQTAVAAARIITNMADDLLGWDACTLDFYLPESDEMQSIINADVLDGRRVELPAEDPRPTTPLAHRIIADGPLLLLRGQAPHFEKELRPFGDAGRRSESLMFVPVRHSQQTIGILSIQSYTPRAYTQADLALLQSLADHCGGALERIRAQETVRQANQRAIQQYELLLERLTLLAQKMGTAADLNTVYRALLEFAQVSAPCDGLMVSSYNPQRQERTCVYAWSPAGEEDVSGLPIMPMTQSPHSRAIETGQIVVSNNLSADLVGQPYVDLGQEADPREPLSALVIPMKVLGRVIGAFEIQTVQPAAYTAEHMTALEMAGNLAAIATQNVGLLQRERNARLATEASEARFQAQAEQVRQIIDTVPEGIVLLTNDYRLALANPAAISTLAALLSESDDHTAVTQGQEQLRQLAGRPIKSLLDPPPAGQLYHELIVETAEQPATPFTFELLAQSLTANSHSNGWVLILRDVTQERQMQLHLQRQDRLAAVGQLAAGIAHDFNNIMSVIVLYAQMVREATDLPENAEQRLDVIYQQAVHATNLVHQILDFSRHSVMVRKPINLLPFVKETIKLLERTFPANIALHLKHDQKEYVVNADPTRLQQILMNLALNARDAMPEGGTLSFSLQKYTLADGGKPPLPEMSPGEWLQLAVADTGIGISPEHLQRLYEPFFTTKEPGQGTGLGLPQVYGIVKQHGGDVVAESRVASETNPVSGTRFTIYLPLIPIIKEETMTPNLPIAADQGAGTILLVEDDPAARKALQDVIEVLGYRVLVAADGRGALDLYSVYKTEIDLVVSDLMMPHMGGVELYRLLKEQQPEIKMIVVTGYPLADEGKTLLEQGIVGWLQKPFTANEIGRKLHRALS